MESAGGVRKTAPKVLFSSSFTRLMSSAPVLVWRNSVAWLLYSVMNSVLTVSNPYVAAASSTLITSGAAAACDACHPVPDVIHRCVMPVCVRRVVRVSASAAAGRWRLRYTQGLAGGEMGGKKLRV